LLSYEKSRHIEFFGAEMDALTTHVYYSSLKIDTQLRAFELRKGFFRIRPSQGRSDTRQKFAYCKGFHDVIVGSGIERQNLVLFRISDSEHDDRSAKRRSKLAARLKPVHVGHIHIQQNQIQVLANHHFDSFLPVLRQRDLIAVTRKRGSQDAANLLLVIHNEDGCVAHRYTSACRNGENKERLGLNMRSQWYARSNKEGLSES
jgi:hypothetical protein